MFLVIIFFVWQILHPGQVGPIWKEMRIPQNISKHTLFVCFGVLALEKFLNILNILNFLYCSVHFEISNKVTKLWILSLRTTGVASCISIFWNMVQCLVLILLKICLKHFYGRKNMEMSWLFIQHFEQQFDYSFWIETVNFEINEIDFVFVLCLRLLWKLSKNVVSSWNH